MNRSIFICSGGRCGTHWIRPILSESLDLRVGLDLKKYNPYNIPFKTEADLIGKIKMKEEREPGGNLYAGHLSIISLLPLINIVSIIILIRDPRDMCISAAYYTPDCHKLTQEEFEKRLNKLLIQGGPNPDFNDSYIESKDKIPHFLLRYEDMVCNDYSSVVKVLDFFGYLYEEEKLKYVLKNNTFEKLSGGRKVGEEDNTAFYRKGIIGDWKNYFTDEMLKKYVERHQILLDEWGY